MEVDLQVSCAMAMLVRDLMLMSKKGDEELLQGELMSRKGAFCPDVSELLTGKAAPYQQVRRFGSRARSQVYGCVAGRAEKRLFQYPSAKQ